MICRSLFWRRFLNRFLDQCSPSKKQQNVWIAANPDASVIHALKMSAYKRKFESETHSQDALVDFWGRKENDGLRNGQLSQSHGS